MCGEMIGKKIENYDTPHTRKVTDSSSVVSTKGYEAESAYTGSASYAKKSRSANVCEFDIARSGVLYFGR